MSQNEILQSLTTILENKLHIDPSEVNLSSSVKYDLGLDSLDQVELIMEIENHYGISVSIEEEEVELGSNPSVKNYVQLIQTKRELQKV